MKGLPSHASKNVVCCVCNHTVLVKQPQPFEYEEKCCDVSACQAAVLEQSQALGVNTM